MKEDISTRTIIDSICIGLLWSFGGPIMALLYCLGIAAEDRRKEEQKQLEEFKETTKGANQNGNAGETDADSGKEVEKFLKDFGHLS